MMAKMRGLKGRVLFLLVLLVLTVSPVQTLTDYPCVQTAQATIKSSHQYEIASANYTPHGIIQINSEDDFTALGFPGTGIESDPYRIENLNISNPGSYWNCIYIDNVVCWFIIKDCLLNNAENGALLVNIIHGTITRTIVRCESVAIELDHCSECLIEESEIHDSFYGISLAYSGNITVRGNSMFTCNDCIHLSACQDCSIGNNSLIDSACGVYAEETTTSRIEQNHADSCYEGIALEGAGKTRIESNNLSNCIYGLYVDSSSDGQITHNLIQRSDFGVYFRDEACRNNTFIYNTLLYSSVYECTDFGEESYYEYNYWASYTGVDANGDGIGDSRYYVLSSGAKYDPHPLMLPINSYTVDVTGPTSIPHYNESYEFTENVTILVDIMDIHSVHKASINYTIDDTTWAEAGLVKQGYYWTVNLGTFALDSIIRFFVTANDSLGNTEQSGEYLIPIVFDNSGPEFPEDLANPEEIEKWLESEYPISSVTFSVAVLDRSGIDTVQAIYMINAPDESWGGLLELSLLDEEEGIYSGTFDLGMTVSNYTAIFIFWANDTLGFSAYSLLRIVHMIHVSSTHPIQVETMPFLIGIAIATVGGTIIVLEVFQERRTRLRQQKEQLVIQRT
jgi:parallel beta-helix repeat protein